MVTEGKLERLGTEAWSTAALGDHFFHSAGIYRDPDSPPCSGPIPDICGRNADDA